jgi:hypothetical protein
VWEAAPVWPPPLPGEVPQRGVQQVQGTGQQVMQVLGGWVGRAGGELDPARLHQLGVYQKLIYLKLDQLYVSSSCS